MNSTRTPETRTFDSNTKYDLIILSCPEQFARLYLVPSTENKFSILLQRAVGVEINSDECDDDVTEFVNCAFFDGEEDDPNRSPYSGVLLDYYVKDPPKTDVVIAKIYNLEIVF